MPTLVSFVAFFVLMLIGNAARLALLLGHISKIYPEIVNAPPPRGWQRPLSSARAGTRSR